MNNRKIQDLETPALLVDLSAVERNLRKMAKFISEGETKLRPHFKNHQCPWLSARQIEAGAIGITCARVEQAEILVSQGIKSVLIANEIVGEKKLSRCAELAKQAEVIVAVDNAHVVAEMGRIARSKGAPLGVLVDVNIGLNRCGVDPGEPALALARTALEHGLLVRGVMGYEGNLNLMPPGPEKERTCGAALQLAVNTQRHLQRQGVSGEIVSAGATGTYSITGRFPGITEIQAGSYLTMDSSFMQVAREFERSLSILATVISKTESKRFVINAGRKTLSGERGLPLVKNLEGVRLIAFHAEHGIIEIENPAVPVDVGDKIQVWVHYADPTVQMHDHMYGTKGSEVVEELKIAR